MSVDRARNDSAALGGVVNGYAPLDANLKIPNTYLSGTAFIGAQATTTSFAIPNTTFKAIDLTTENFDTDNFHDNSTNPSRMTIPAGFGGKYLIIGGYSTPNDSNGVRYTLIYKNGSEVNLGGLRDDAPSASGGYGFTREASAIIDLVPGDYIQLVTYQDSGSSLNYSAHLTIYKLDSGKVGTGIGAKITKGSDQTVTSGAYPVSVTFPGTDEYDTDGFHDPSTNSSRITIPPGLGGKYIVLYNLLWKNNATGERHSYIMKNGTQVKGGASRLGANTSEETWLTGSTSLDLIPGDYIELGAYHTKGSSLDIRGDNTTLEIVRVDSGGTQGDYVKLKETELSADAADITITGIPGTYKDLIIVSEAHTTWASHTIDDLYLRVGTGGTIDTGSNYTYSVDYRGTSNGNVGGSSQTFYYMGVTPGATGGSGYFSNHETTIYGYAKTDRKQSLRSQSGFHDTVSSYFTDGTGAWKNGAAAIDCVRIFSINANLLAGSRLTIYGRK